MAPVLIAAAFVAVTFGFALFAYHKIQKADKAVYAARSALNVHTSFRRETVKNLASLSAGLAADNGAADAAVARLKTGPEADCKITALGELESVLSSNLSAFFKTAEEVPALSGSESFASYKKSIIKAGGKIKTSAAHYNSCARDYNTLISVFPAMIVAKMFDYSAADYFNFETSEA